MTCPMEYRQLCRSGSQTIGCIHSVTLRVSAVSVAIAVNTATIAATEVGALFTTVFI